MIMEAQERCTEIIFKDKTTKPEDPRLRYKI